MATPNLLPAAACIPAYWAGRIAAGRPVIAGQLAEPAEDVIPVPGMLTGDEDLVALWAAGDSILGDAIADWVIVREQPNAKTATSEEQAKPQPSADAEPQPGTPARWNPRRAGGALLIAVTGGLIVFHPAGDLQHIRLIWV